MIMNNRLFPDRESEMDEEDDDIIDRADDDIPVSQDNRLPFKTFSAKYFERGYSCYRSTLGLEDDEMPSRLCIIDKHGEEEVFFLERVEEEGENKTWIFNGGGGHRLVIFDA